MPVTPSTRALITWAEYKALLGISEDSEMDRYQTIINQASSRIEGYCRRALKATDYTTTAALVLDGSGTRELIVPHYPVNSITHLYIDSARAFGAETEVLAAEYSLRAAAGLILLYSRTFPRALDAVKLECNAGYATTSPEWQDIQAACFELVRWMDSRYRGFIGKRSETNADGMNIGFEIDLPVNVRSILEPFVGRGAS